MLSRIRSYGLLGIYAYPVEIEVDTNDGLPSFSLVGLPDTAVKESKERVRSAIKNSGYQFPSGRITVSLAPADTPKTGPAFDLAIALGIMSASGQIPQEWLESYILIAELALDGQLRPIKGALSMALAMRKSRIKNLILPKENAREASVIEGLRVFAPLNLKDTVYTLGNQDTVEPITSSPFCPPEIESTSPPDFSEIKGQFLARRALEVACAGSHNVLMIGPPGSGKTMLAKRIPSILPEMDLEEAIEVTQFHSLLGLVPAETGLVTSRPFRNPHHTISDIALIGGGSIPQPGEISLAHHGVLFLDELPEFHRDALEVLRQPLEDGFIRISRANGSMVFPASFMLVAAMNPCPCGYYTDQRRSCRCNPYQIQKYLGKISGPLLDRIDIHLEVRSLECSHMLSEQEAEPSSLLRERVKQARKIQRERLAKEKIKTNSRMGHRQIKKYCPLNPEAKQLLKMAIDELGFSARAYDKILKVARTVSDLAASETILPEHIAEAIQYRSLDREFWR